MNAADFDFLITYIQGYGIPYLSGKLIIIFEIYGNVGLQVRTWGMYSHHENLGFRIHMHHVQRGEVSI